MEDVGSLIPPAQPDAVLFMGAPIVRPLLNLLDGSSIETRLGRRALILVAEEMEHAPQVPGAHVPEIDGVKVLVQVFPYLWPNDGLGLVAILRPESGSPGSDIVIHPGIAATRRNGTASERALLAHLVGNGEDARRIGGHLPVESHLGLGDSDVIGCDAPIPASLGRERHARIWEACLRHVDCDVGHGRLLQARVSCQTWRKQRI